MWHLFERVIWQVIVSCYLTSMHFFFSCIWLMKFLVANRTRNFEMKCCNIDLFWTIYFQTTYILYIFFFTDILNSISAWHSTYMCFILKPTLHLILAAKCLKMEWNILLSSILTLMHLIFMRYLYNNQLWRFKNRRNLWWNWLCMLCIKIRLLLQKGFHTYVIWGSVHFFLIFPVYKKKSFLTSLIMAASQYWPFF